MRGNRATRKLDRYNEGVYRDIIRTQARLDQYAAIPRTLALLITTLDESANTPAPTRSTSPTSSNAAAR